VLVAEKIINVAERDERDPQRLRSSFLAIRDGGLRIVGACSTLRCMACGQFLISAIAQHSYL
jgi:hypothetical protein